MTKDSKTTPKRGRKKSDKKTYGVLMREKQDKDNPQYLAEYRGAIAYIRYLKN